MSGATWDNLYLVPGGGTLTVGACASYLNAGLGLCGNLNVVTSGLNKFSYSIAQQTSGDNFSISVTDNGGTIGSGKFQVKSSTGKGFSVDSFGAVTFDSGINGASSVAEDATVLGSQSLTNPNLTGGTSWTQTGDCALASDAGTCTFSGGLGSRISQAYGTLAVIGIANRTYSFTYTISGLTGTPSASIDTAFALAGTPLVMTAGTHTVLFTSAASPGAFNIYTVLTTGQAFTIDSLSLKAVTGGIITSPFHRGDPVNFADIPSCTASLIGSLLYCNDCKNVTDDTTGLYDVAYAGGGHGNNVLCVNAATPSWRNR